MKTQNLFFMKLLCFKNIFSMPFVNFGCMAIAVLISCILLNYAVVAPSREFVTICENVLYEYIESPSDFFLPDDVFIVLKENSIVATMPRAFVQITAIESNDSLYEFNRQIFWCEFLVSYFCIFMLILAIFYTILEIILLVVIKVWKFFISVLAVFKSHFAKKFIKFKDFCERKYKQNQRLDYDNPKLKEFFQLGYNIGRADGIAEGTQMAKSDLANQN